MADEQHPDIEKFFSDPKFQGDREFFRAINRRYFEEAIKESAQQKAPREGNFFDMLASALGLIKSPGSESVFDRYFGGRNK